MRTLYAFAFIAIITSCTQNETKELDDFVIFSGKIENKEDISLKLYDSNDQVTKITLMEDGSFIDTLAINSPTYSILTAGTQKKVLFLVPGGTLNLQFDLASLKSAPIYGGTLASENIYLNKKAENNPASDYATFYADEEKAFLTKIDSLHKVRTRLLESSNTSNLFKNIEKKNLGFERQDFITRYPEYHPYFSSNKKYVASKNFGSEFQNFDTDNEESAITFPIYRNLILSEFQKSYLKIDSTFSNFDLLISKIAEKNSPRVRDELMMFALTAFRPNITDLAQKKDKLLALASAPHIKDKITNKFDKIKNLTSGNPSPSFTYENYKGGTTSLADLMGKYLYIDVWATWCGPCIAEIPFLKKLEEDLKEKDIAFVSISIDQNEDYQKWRNMIAQKNLGGIQLMADNAQDSELLKNYAIESIPRFIILDPQGHIVNADAPRPSNPKLKGQLLDLVK